uniref:ZAD domain-containing protein n=1 Tax=Megaselia scalaris TaxID=36166 RepID=T1GHM2_MEGSC
MDFFAGCRVCLLVQSKMKSIKSFSGDNIIEKINNVLDSKINTKIGSDKICIDCFSKLLDYDMFRSCFIANNKMVNDFFHKQSLINIFEDSDSNQSNENQESTRNKPELSIKKIRKTTDETKEISKNVDSQKLKVVAEKKSDSTTSSALEEKQKSKDAHDKISQRKSSTEALLKDLSVPQIKTKIEKEFKKSDSKSKKRKNSSHSSERSKKKSSKSHNHESKRSSESENKNSNSEKKTDIVDKKTDSSVNSEAIQEIESTNQTIKDSAKEDTTKELISVLSASKEESTKSQEIEKKEDIVNKDPSFYR